MALTKFALTLLAPHLAGARILTLGYPDLLATREETEKLLNCGPLARINSKASAAHKMNGRALADTEEAFAAAGAQSLRCVDLFPSRGVEEIVDLNEPVNGWADSFDLVIDAGTIEHCANIGQALMNAANAVAPGGRVFHSPPVSMLNHGFYNICPTLLHDFYTQNRWQIEHLSGFRVADFSGFDVAPTRRARVPEESALYFLARRGKVAGNLCWPTQTKYRIEDGAR